MKEEFPSMRERIRIAQKTMRKFEKWHGWILGPLGTVLIASGVVMFVLAAIKVGTQGLSETAFFDLALAGILIGLGGVLCSVVANWISYVSLELAILFNQFPEFMQKIEELLGKPQSNKDKPQE